MSEELKKEAIEAINNCLPDLYSVGVADDVIAEYIDKAYEDGHAVGTGQAYLKATLAEQKRLNGLAELATLAERKRCMKDVCPECNGNCPLYESQPSGKPNAAGNYTHKAKDDSGDVLCGASNIISRGNFRGEVFSALNHQDDE